LVILDLWASADTGEFSLDAKVGAAREGYVASTCEVGGRSTFEAAFGDG